MTDKAAKDAYCHQGGHRTVGQIPQNVKKLKLDVTDMVYSICVCFLKLILYNSKPQHQMCD